MITTRKNPIDFLKREEKEFSIESSGSSIKYITKRGVIIYRPDPVNFKNKDFGMFGHIRSNAEYLINEGLIDANVEKKSKFISMSSFINDIDRPIRDVYEIDLRGAHWIIAKKLGLMNDNIFNEYYNSKSKRVKFVRNMSIGSLSMKKDFYEFKKGEISYIRSEKKITENVYWTIANYCNKIMKDCMEISENSFLFYWVDAIFILGSEKIRNEICNEIKYKGFDFKIVKIEKMTRLDQILFVKSGNELRKFSIPHHIVRKEILNK